MSGYRNDGCSFSHGWGSAVFDGVEVSERPCPDKAFHSTSAGPIQAVSFMRDVFVLVGGYLCASPIPLYVQASGKVRHGVCLQGV